MLSDENPLEELRQEMIDDPVFVHLAERAAFGDFCGRCYVLAQRDWFESLWKEMWVSKCLSE